MHGSLFTDLPWNSLVEARKVCVLVPLVVVDELDAIKDRGGEDGKWARRVIKEMERVAPAGLGPHPVRTNVTM